MIVGIFYYKQYLFLEISAHKYAIAGLISRNIKKILIVLYILSPNVKAPHSPNVEML